MNYAEKAEQLRAERLEKERLEAERKAKEQQEAAEKQKQQAEQQKQKAEELLPLFKQFDGPDGPKICGGRVSLKAELANDYGRITGVLLKIAGGDLSGLQSYPMGALLLGAHYDPDAQKYGLVRYEMPPRPPHVGYSLVGKYTTADELMNAVADEVSKH